MSGHSARLWSVERPVAVSRHEPEAPERAGREWCEACGETPQRCEKVLLKSGGEKRKEPGGCQPHLSYGCPSDHASGFAGHLRLLDACLGKWGGRERKSGSSGESDARSSIRRPTIGPGRKVAGASGIPPLVHHCSIAMVIRPAWSVSSHQSRQQSCEEAMAREGKQIRPACVDQIHHLQSVRCVVNAV